MKPCGGSGGGCSSCSGSTTGAAGVDEETGEVKANSLISSYVGPHYQMFSAPTGTSDSKVCSGVQKIVIFNYPGCNGTSVRHTHVWTDCGDVYCLNESNWVNSVATLTNGDKLTRLSQGTGNWDIVWQEPEGRLVKHKVSEGDNGNDYIYEIVNSDGSKTTAVIEGNVYKYTDSQYGGTSPVTHNYTVVSGKLTNYEATSNGVVTISTNLAYTNNKVTGLTISQPNEVNKSISMSYDGTGSLTSVNQNGKITRYTRTTDSQGRLKNTVTIEDAQGNVYGITEYLYDTYTTTVTVIDAQNPSMTTDQVTTSYYITDTTGNKRYLYKVIAPDNSVTLNKVYAPVGYLTEAGVITSGSETYFYKETTTQALWGNSISATQLYGTSNARTTSYAYDSQGRVTSVTYPPVNYGVAGSTVTETQNTPVQTTSYTGNYMTSKTDLDGSSTTYAYNDQGQLTKEEVTRDGVTVTTTYSYVVSLGPVASKRIVTNSPSCDWLTEYTYYDSNSGAQAGLLQSETLKNGSNNTVQQIKVYNYLQNGQVQPGPTNTTTTYNNADGTTFRTVSESCIYDPYGGIVSFTDPYSRLISYSNTSTPEQKTERVIFNSDAYTEIVKDCCKTLYSTDVEGKINYYVYDAIGRKIAIYTDEEGQSEDSPGVAFSYDGFGRIRSVTTKKNLSTQQTSSYTYDNMNRLIYIDNPDGVSDEYMYYNSYGNMYAKSIGAGRTYMYKYDAFNRITDTYYLASRPTPVDYPTTLPNIHYVYNRSTNSLMAVNQDNGQMRYTTNSLGQLASVYWPHVGKSVNYTYDNMGRKSSVTYDGQSMEYTYDPMSNLTSVYTGSNLVATYTNDNAGHHTRVDFGNNTWQTFAYGNDVRYMVTGIDYAYKCDINDSITNKGGIRLTRTNGGNPLSWADNTSKFIKSYTYDSRGRITSSDIPGYGRYAFNYDWANNRIVPTALYNEANQLVSLAGSTYSYNTEGDLISGGGKSYSYNNSGIINSLSENGITYSYTWDYLGNLISKNNGVNTDKYVYDILANVPSIIADVSINNVTQAFYFRDPNGRLVMRKSSDDLKYYHFDEMGNTLFLTDANGVLTDRYIYDGLGNICFRSGNTNNPALFRGQYGFTSLVTGNDSLCLYGHDIYNTSIGRAISNSTTNSDYICGDSRAKKDNKKPVRWVHQNIGESSLCSNSPLCKHYFHGSGTDYILPKELKQKFWNHWTVLGAIAAFDLDIKTKAQTLTRNRCSCSTPPSYKIPIYPNFYFELNGGKAANLTLGDPRGPLWAIGNTYIRFESTNHVTANCQTRSGHLEIQRHSALRDEFRDPDDAFDTSPDENVEWIGGTPYSICSDDYATFTIPFNF